jgi:rod shape-determining protein MreB
MRTALGLLASPDLALDVGTAHTRIGRIGGHILAEAPSRPPREQHEDVPAAPLEHGVVRDVAGVVRFLRPLLQGARGRWPVRPRVLAFTPSDASREERDALVEAAREAGADQVALLPEPVAAAVGASLDLASPHAHLLVDIGEGVTDLALFVGGRLAQTAALRLACGELRGEVTRVVAGLHGFQLEPDQADGLLRQLGPPGPADSEWLVARRRHTRSRNHAGRVVVEVDTFVRAGQLCEAVDPLCARLAAFVDGVVRALDARAAAEVIESGLLVTGGGALLPRLTAQLAHVTRLDVRAAHDPLRAVIRGACRLLPQADREGLWAPG